MSVKKLARLLADVTVDALYVYVRRERCPTVVHRAMFVSDRPVPISECGTKERGGWRVVSAEYTELPHCRRCEGILARRTHDAPPPDTTQ